MWPFSNAPAPAEVRPRLGIFGKRPDTGDFITLGHTGGPAEAVRAWVDRGIELSGLGDRQAWRAAFQAAAPIAFHYTPPGAADSCVGVIAPSHDLTGRDYPVCALVTVPTSSLALHRHLIPAVLSPWAGEVLGALQASDWQGLLEASDVIAWPNSAHWAEAAASYEAWKSTTSVAELSAGIYGVSDCGALRAGLELLSATSLPFRGKEREETPLGARAPAGDLGVIALAFWLEALHRLVSWNKRCPSLFWSTQLEFHLGTPTPASFRDLWQPEIESDYLADLGSARGGGSLPASVEKVLVTGGTVAQLLNAMD